MLFTFAETAGRIHVCIFTFAGTAGGETCMSSTFAERRDMYVLTTSRPKAVSLPHFIRGPGGKSARNEKSIRPQEPQIRLSGRPGGHVCYFIFAGRLAGDMYAFYFRRDGRMGDMYVFHFRGRGHVCFFIFAGPAGRRHVCFLLSRGRPEGRHGCSFIFAERRDMYVLFDEQAKGCQFASIYKGS